MYELQIKEFLSKLPVFTLGDVNQIVKNRNYAKMIIKRLVEKKVVLKVKKGLYTFHDDPFLVATFIVRPSYVSSVSALYYHRRITQIPNQIFCFTKKRSGKYFFISYINFYHTKHFFGFRIEKYKGFNIPIATVEKAIIDSIGRIPISVIEEAFEEKIDEKLMVLYLKKLKKSSIVKRIGHLLEKNGYDIYSEVKHLIDNKYVVFDPLIKKVRGIKDKKWKVIL